MFNVYLNYHAEFTTIEKGKQSLNLTMPDIKFHGTENPHYHVRNFVSVITLEGIDRDILHFIFP